MLFQAQIDTQRRHILQSQKVDNTTRARSQNKNEPNSDEVSTNNDEHMNTFSGQPLPKSYGHSYARCTDIMAANSVRGHTHHERVHSTSNAIQTCRSAPM